ncbi:hypothetical protein C5167_040729 [Papaver somniferum]|uniref:Polygalacturonase n=1 Tax=Papaver somniferum TaxID=3469 RepID=A0A4Y7IJA8_PAPSO|nr:polygalacturonase-like [Papaver somniferum]RZC47791.1 hypothetical protein C5167_040729 [Papaver somniferum]
MFNKFMSTSILLRLGLNLFIFSIFILHPLPTNAVTYNVQNFGAKPDGGKTSSTKSLLKAWDIACKSVKPSTIYVPPGTYLINQVVFSGPCKSKITFQIDGTLVAPTNYYGVGNTGSWILFNSVTGLTVLGGTIDAHGSGYWACKRSGRNCPQSARSMLFTGSKNIVINGLTSIDSQQAHLSFNGCDNVMMKNLKIIAPEDSPNTDGIHVQMSNDVTITDSSIQTGDDCVSIGPGAKTILFKRIECGPGHGISIGSLARDLNEEGVQDITVKNVTFSKSQNGLRIKTWARPSNGFVKNVLYQNIVMNDVLNPIIIDQNYCPGDKGCPNQNSGVKISGVTYQNIRGTSASPVAIKFGCSPTTPCSGIKLQSVKLINFDHKPAQSVCLNAGGTALGLVSPRSCL